MSFVWLHVAWFVLWIGLNTSRITRHHFDPFPFTFLTLVVSLEAIFLSNFILIAGNHASRQSERRNHLDLQINLLAEQENTKVLWMLERIANHVGADIAGDPDLQVLEEATEPERLLKQIDSSLAENR